MRINLKRMFPALRTHEGARARVITDAQRLRRLVLPCLLWEDAFYVDGKTIAEQIREGVAAVPAGVAAALAIEARERFHLRHAPLWVVREMARHHAGSSIVGDTLARVIGRPDEIGEFVALYWKDKREPLSAQAKKGLAKAFAKFDRYQLAKYAKGGAVRLRDVMFLTHPKPGEDAAGAFREIADDAISAKDAGTWEARLSAGEDKKAAFDDLLRSSRLGYLALLRNLRNMIDAGIDEAVLREAIVARRGARRVLPFRYVAAARAVPRLEGAIDQACRRRLPRCRRFPAGRSCWSTCRDRWRAGCPASPISPGWTRRRRLPPSSRATCGCSRSRTTSSRCRRAAAWPVSTRSSVRSRTAGPTWARR
jgi:60 kDa SS-A/Ro ribonucleoprotein